MTTARTAPPIARGHIYRDVYDKRVDTRPVERDADLQRARVAGDRIASDGAAALRRALRDGVFLLEIPDELDIAAGDEFATTFHDGPFRDVTADAFGDPLLGFHERVDQIEQFLLERRFWAASYPAPVAGLGEALTALSRTVLRSVLAAVGVPEPLWSRATGGCADGGGSYHLTFNHYRPVVDAVGLSSHKDDGFVTILRTTAPGLQVNRARQWEAVPVVPDCFVVNFGLSMELLTAACEQPVAAIVHRVARQDAERSSFGHFTSSACVPGRDAGVYAYVPGRGLDLVCGSRELIVENDHEIYEGTEAPERAS